MGCHARTGETGIYVTIFSFIHIVGYCVITNFVLIKIVGPSKNQFLLPFVFNNIVGPSFILTPPPISAGFFGSIRRKLPTPTKPFTLNHMMAFQ